MCLAPKRLPALKFDGQAGHLLSDIMTTVPELLGEASDHGGVPWLIHLSDDD